MIGVAPQSESAVPTTARLTWEEAVDWARRTPEMADLVQICYYDDPIEAAARRFKASEEWQAIVSLLWPWPGAKVLEIGAGRGIVSWAFASAGCEVHAIEPDPSPIVGAGAMRSLSEATGQQIAIVDTVGERLGFDAATFDIVICRAVLHHVSDLDQVAREVHRVLKPGGKFLAIKEHIAETPAELAAFLKSHPLHHLYGGEHAFALGDYLGSLKRGGFRRIVKYGPFDHAVTSAPATTTEQLRRQLHGALAGRLPAALAGRLATSDRLLGLYRRWLSYRCRAPGRLYSFLATKAA